MSNDGSSNPGHMSPEQFRAAGHDVIDWIADYWKNIESLPVLSRVQPGDVLARLPPHPPLKGEWLMEDVGAGRTSSTSSLRLSVSSSLLRDLDSIILPGITHWQHPNFYAYFPANISGPAVLGELLSAGLGVQGMLWATSPACTELETRMLDWLGEMIGLPGSFLSTAESGGGGGVIQGTASEATLVALLAARARAGHPSHPTLYASTQAHSSVVKAAMIAGLARTPDDHTHLRLIDVDREFRLRPDALEAAMREDLRAGRTPIFVCATIGTTGCTAIDPLADIAALTSSLRLSVSSSLSPWLHADAAHAGAACICPEYRAWLRGVEHADSIAFNPHKWLLTNFDCNCFWTRDRASLLAALSITPEFLRNAASQSGQVTDYRDWQVPLGRRFRALKLWFVIRHYGVEGLQAHIREHMRLAQLLEQLVREDARFEVCAPRTMNLLCFRLAPRVGQAPAATDARSQALLDAINASGQAYLTHASLPVFDERGRATGSRFFIRMAVGGAQTQEHHVRATWSLIQRLATITV